MTLLRVTALAAVVLAPAVALANPHLERAKTALDDLQFEEAYDALDEALRAGDSEVEQTLEIYQLLGEVAAALGQEDEAVDAFELLLTLAPKHRLRDGVSPKIREPFDQARSRVDGRESLRLSCEVTSKDPMTLVVVVRSNPLDLATGALVVDGGGDNRAPLVAGSASITLAIGGRASRVGLTDESGNQIAIMKASQCADDVEVVLTDPTPSPKPADDDGSILGHWALWGGVAIACGAAGTYFGLQAQSDVDELNVIYANSGDYEYSEAMDKEDSARRNALFANIGFVAAGGAAIAAGVLLLRSGDDNPAKDEMVVAPTATPDGVGVMFAMPF